MVVADVREEEGVVAEGVGVVGVGVNGPLVHRLGPVMVVTDVREENGVKTK